MFISLRLLGNQVWEDTLLHLCIRERLSETAQLLLQPHLLAGHTNYLVQRGAVDGKTPAELARRNGMTRVAELAESAAVSQSASCRQTGGEIGFQAAECMGSVN